MERPNINILRECKTICITSIEFTNHDHKIIERDERGAGLILDNDEEYYSGMVTNIEQSYSDIEREAI